MRSVDKNPTTELPSFFKSVIGSLTKDQTSSGHPYGPLTLPIMSDALNIYHTNPQLRIISPNQELNEHYDDFAGMVAIFEHRPDHDQSAFNHLGNSPNVVGTKNFLDEILKDNDSQVDQYNYLRTRLFDMILSDWSRHEDNWRWASYNQDKGKYYKAIPRDRDHVYYYLDGVFPRIARTLIKKHFQTFTMDLKNLVDLNSSGEHLDRHLLWSLESEDWKMAADSVKLLLTDEVIDEAMTALPKEIYEMNASWLAERLKSRRDQLPNEIHKYYQHINKKPKIYGTDKHEKFIVELIDENVMIEVWKTNKSGIEKKLLHKRLFNEEETKVISIFGLAGNDQFVFKGNSKTKIKMKVYGGADEDSYVQEIDKKLVKAKVVDTETGNSFKIKKGIKLKVKEEPAVEEFDANGVLLQYYVWD